MPIIRVPKCIRDPLSCIKPPKFSVNSMIDQLTKMRNEITDLPEDVKREVDNTTEYIKHWNEQQLNVYTQAYNKLVQVAVELSSQLGADEAAKKIIAKSVTLYQESGGSKVDDCASIVRAMVLFYAYTIKETQPNLFTALMASLLEPNAIPAACRLVIH